jgi:hypothetical protein
MGYFYGSVATLLGINETTQLHHAVYGGHVDLRYLKQRVTQDFRLNLSCNGSVIYVLYGSFSFLA